MSKFEVKLFGRAECAGGVLGLSRDGEGLYNTSRLTLERFAPNPARVATCTQVARRIQTLRAFRRAMRSAVSVACDRQWPRQRRRVGSEVEFKFKIRLNRVA